MFFLVFIILIRKKHSLAIPTCPLFMLLQQFLANASLLRGTTHYFEIAIKRYSRGELVIYDRKKHRIT